MLLDNERNEIWFSRLLLMYSCFCFQNFQIRYFKEYLIANGMYSEALSLPFFYISIISQCYKMYLIVEIDIRLFIELFRFYFSIVLNFSQNRQQFPMSFLRNPYTSSNPNNFRGSNIQNHHPSEPSKRLNQQIQNKTTYNTPNLNTPLSTKFKDSFIGGLNSYSEDFYKSQVMERAIGGETIKLNAMDSYQPLSADQPTVMNQIRQEHVKIMDNKLQQAIQINGGNALQQVKTIIVEPLADVVQIKQSAVKEGFHAINRKSTVSNVSNVPPYPSCCVSNISIGSPLVPNHTMQLKKSSVSISQPVKQSHSRIEYIPFQRKIKDVQTRERVQLVPHERVIIQYQQKRIVQQVPVQRTVLDYYTIEHITEYQPQTIQQTIVQMVPVEKTYHTTNYIPIQQQIIHMPGQNGKQGQSRIVYQGPPTYEGNAALKGQSRITYQSPILQPKSTFSHNNIVKDTTINQKKIVSNLSNNVSRVAFNPINITNGITNEKLRQNQKQFSGNFCEEGLPFTNQLKQQMKIQNNTTVQQNYVQPFQMNVYQPPHQAQGCYENYVTENLNHWNTHQQLENYGQNNYNKKNFNFNHELKIQVNSKGMKRQNSGITLTR